MVKKNGYVLIIGSSNMDLNIYSQQLPKPGETVTGGTFKQFLGGKGANQAVASARSGSKTIFIAKIGMDSFGDQMINQLEKEGVDISHIIRDAVESSGIALIMVDKNGENMISVAPGANVKLLPREIQRYADLIKNANSLVVQMEIPTETIDLIYNIASKGEVIKILNPAPLKHLPQNIIKNVDIIIPNEGELFRLNSMLNFDEIPNLTEESIVKASKNLTEMGVETVITTLGSKGCLIYQARNNKVTKIPAYKVQAVDSVGAGDCFNGVLASKLNQGESLINAVKYATAAASIAVTRKGAQESIPNLNEIEKRLNEFKELMK